MSKRFAAKQSRLRSFQQQVNRLTAAISRLEGESWRLSSVRLGIVVAATIGVIAATRLTTSGVAWAVFAVSVLLFGWVVRIHRRLRWELRRFQLLHTITREQIGRMTLDWDNIPETINVPNSERSALEVDFDLLGGRSLLRLLDSSISAESTTRLRTWLNAGRANSAEIIHRQALIRELIPLRAFRNRLSISARLINSNSSQWSSDYLQSWLEKPASGQLQRLFWPAVVLAVVNALLFIAAQLGVIGGWWQFTLLAYAVINVLALNETGAAFNEAGSLRDALEEYQVMFGELERFRYRNRPKLAKLCAPFLENGSANKPSQQLNRVVRVLGGMGLTMGNPVLSFLLHVLFPWHIFFTLQLESVKSQLAQQLPQWLDIWFELEALNSLANFAYLNPHYTFPALVTNSKPYTATQLSHPLLPDAEKIANDCESGDVGTINIITGSNMSGKSTFMRTIGINLVLAYAGGVVDATQFSLAPARLASCIRVSDSIADGFSYFYAEVRCLKMILDALENSDEALPLIFFIDEIFRGTNNRERLIGSRSLIRQMAQQNGVGLLATHDLELAQLSNEVPLIRNFHFREEVLDGKMVFDYLLRNGPSPTTNALRIMQLAGLPIDS